MAPVIDKGLRQEGPQKMIQTIKTAERTEETKTDAGRAEAEAGEESPSRRETVSGVI